MVAALVKDVGLVLLGTVLGAILGPYVRRYFTQIDKRKEEIYRPMYSELNEVTSGDPRDFPFSDEFNSHWNDIPEYRKENMDQQIKSQLEEYSAELDTLNSFLSGVEQSIASRVGEAEELEETEGGVMISYTTTDGTPTRLPVDTFTEKFGPVLLIADSPAELRDLMIEYLESQRQHPYLPLRELDMSYFNLYYEAINEGVAEVEETYGGLNEQIEGISESANRILKRLSKKV